MLDFNDQECHVKNGSVRDYAIVMKNKSSKNQIILLTNNFSALFLRSGA